MEYHQVAECIPEVVFPLMKPFIDRVEEAIKPGLTMLNWTSLNVYSCELNLRNLLNQLFLPTIQLIGALLKEAIGLWFFFSFYCIRNFERACYHEWVGLMTGILNYYKKFF